MCEKTRLKKLVCLPLILTLFLWLLTGCAEKQADATIVVATKSDIGNIEPCQMKQATFLVYQGLVTLDPKLNNTPCLAASWQPSADGKEWTFNLRKGVKFHDGSEFDSSDVKVTFERIKESGLMTDVELERVECPDKHTVKFILKEPNFMFPNLLTSYNYAIISETALGPDGKLLKAIGTGPFIFEDWIKGDRVVLKANQEYWAGRPRLDKVIVRIIPEPEVAVSALEAGEIDMTLLFQAVSYIDQVKQNPNLKITSTVGDVNNMLVMNVARAPFNDLKVRKALNYAVEKKQTVASLFGEVAEPQDYMFCSIWDKYLNKSAPRYEYNPEKAKELLAEAGWKDVDGDGILEKGGKKFEFEMAYRANAPDHTKLAEVLQSQFAQLGIKVHLKPMEAGALSKAARERKFDTYLTGQWANIYDEPGPVYEFYYKRNGIYEIWSSDETDRLIAALKATQNLEDRIKIHHQIQQKVMENAPVIYLYNEKYVMAMKKRVKNFEVCAEFWHMFCTLEKTYFEH